MLNPGQAACPGRSEVDPGDGEPRCAGEALLDELGAVRAAFWRLRVAGQPVREVQPGVQR